MLGTNDRTHTHRVSVSRGENTAMAIQYRPESTKTAVSTLLAVLSVTLQ